MIRDKNCWKVATIERVYATHSRVVYKSNSPTRLCNYLKKLLQEKDDFIGVEYIISLKDSIEETEK